MQKKITFQLLAVLLLALSAFLFFKTNTSSPTNETVEEKTSGAYQALNLFGLARTYPFAKIPDQAHYAAWQSIQQNTATQRDNPTEPWESMGPKNHGGRTLALAFNPQNPNTMYAGSASGGLWRSYSAGEGAEAWEYVATGYPVLGVSCITFNPGDSMTMYIGTGEVYNIAQAGTGAAYRSTRGSYGMGILKSVDGGITWNKSLDWSYAQNHGVWAVKISQQNSNIVYASTTNGVYKSTDAGSSWTQVHDVVMGTSLLIHPTNDDIVVAAHGNFSSPGFGIYKTIDGGQSWTKIESSLPTQFNGKILLEAAPTNSDIIYASIGNGFGNSDGASWLLKSNDFGWNWTLQSQTDYSKWQGWFGHDVAVSPDNPNDLTVVGIEVWKSANGGASLQIVSNGGNGGLGIDTPPLEGPDGGPQFVHSDCHDVIFHPTDPNIFYVANDGGIHRSLDNGQSFHSCNGGYQSVQFYNGFSNSHQDSIFCIGGLQDNGTIHWQGGVIWTRVFGADGSWTAINPADDNIVFVSYQGLSMQKSINHAQSFSNASPPSNNENTMFIAPYVIGTDNPDVLYAGRSRIYKTNNSASFWQATNNGDVLDGNAVLSMAISPQNSNVVYAATGPTTLFGGTKGNVFVTTDGGDTWVNITSDLPDRFPMDMTVDPTNEAIAYITFSGFGTGHVFKTEDYGVSWEDISIDLPDVSTNAVIVDPLFSNNIYVGNDLGVFASIDGGLNWEPYMEGLFDATMVFDLKISPVNRKLRAATHGNGAFQRDLLEEEIVSTKKPVAEHFINLTVFPNPASNQTTIQYQMKESGKVNAELVDLKGRMVKTLFNENQNIGNQEFTFEVSDLPSGNYFLRMNSGNKIQVEKIAVVK